MDKLLEEFIKDWRLKNNSKDAIYSSYHYDAMIEFAKHYHSQQLTIPIVMRSTLERKEAEYKLACEWFETEYDSISDEDEVAEQEKVCYGLNEQIKLLRHLLSEYCA